MIHLIVVIVYLSDIFLDLEIKTEQDCTDVI